MKALHTCDNCHNQLFPLLFVIIELETRFYVSVKPPVFHSTPELFYFLQICSFYFLFFFFVLCLKTKGNPICFCFALNKFIQLKIRFLPKVFSLIAVFHNHFYSNHIFSLYDAIIVICAFFNIYKSIP